MSEKERLDVLAVKKGLFPSREKAQAAILAGDVYINNQKADKPGMKIPEDTIIEVRGMSLPYVSRGGLKLEKAMAVFNIDIKDRVAMDVGASTGGFTDCMLKNGARKVYAVDVGYGQLAWELRNDPRVVVMERTNIRYLTRDKIEDDIEFVSIDVSFISLTKVLGPLKGLLSERAHLVCLVKPQFEAGREKVGRKGVVRDPSTHEEVLETVIGYALGIGYRYRQLDFSPIKGPEGNIEYLLRLEYIKRDDESGAGDRQGSAGTDGKASQDAHGCADFDSIREDIRRTVKKSHEVL